MSIEQNEHAQACAPSYLHLPDDGADFVCPECGETGRRGFVKAFTPDGRNHYAQHFDCLDEWWRERATDMGTAS